MELYHGTDTFFEEFSNDFLATPDSNDQYGSGFYFYSVKSKTAMHGGLRVYADVEIKKPIEHDAQIFLTWDDVYDMIMACPNLDYTLDNYGDIEYEGYETVLNRAIDSYVGMQILTGLNMLGNDFFPGKDCHILLTKFVKTTGIDCITDLSRDIYVILTKQQITIKKVIHEQEDNDE